MAITKIKPLKSTLRKALDYICNPDKTDEGLLVSSYSCSPETADIEFEYTAKHGTQRGDILAYHLIQSFKPGEISVVEAHRIGEELAAQALMGRYEYVITTHIDKGHIHNHIIFNSCSYVTKHKYRDNDKSLAYIQKCNDKLCRENGLDVIEQKSGNRGKRYYEYQQHTKGDSFKTKLKETMDKVIKTSVDFEEFLLQMEMCGYEIRQEKNLAFRALEQKYYTNAKTLGDNYTQEKIMERILHKEKEETVDREQTVYTVKKKYVQYYEVNLIVDIQACMADRNSEGYKYCLMIGNINQMARTLDYLVSHAIRTSGELLNKISEVKERRDVTKEQLKTVEKSMRQLSEKIKYAKNFWKYKSIYEQSKNADPKSKFLEEHRTELTLFHAAENYIRRNRIKLKDLNVKGMTAEYCELNGKKKQLKESLKNLEKELSELENVKQNAEKILNKKFEREEKQERDKDQKTDKGK